MEFAPSSLSIYTALFSAVLLSLVPALLFDVAMSYCNTTTTYATRVYTTYSTSYTSSYATVTPSTATTYTTYSCPAAYSTYWTYTTAPTYTSSSAYSTSTYYSCPPQYITTYAYGKTFKRSSSAPRLIFYRYSIHHIYNLSNYVLSYFDVSYLLPYNILLHNCRISNHELCECRSDLP